MVSTPVFCGVIGPETQCHSDTVKPQLSKPIQLVQIIEGTFVYEDTLFPRKLKQETSLDNREI